jgi:hypothetical protein
MIKLFADLVVAAALPWFLGMVFDAVTYLHVPYPSLWMEQSRAVVPVALALVYTLLGVLLVFSIRQLFKKK